MLESPPQGNFSCCRYIILPAFLLLLAMIFSFSTWRDENKLSCAYNDKGLLLRKESREETVELEYDERFNKISWVKRRRSNNWFDTPEISTYEYNDQGDLIRAVSPEGEIVLLGYDDQAHITSLEYVGHHVLDLTWNDLHQPTVISVRGGDSITATYEQGELAEIFSDEADHEMVTKIIKTYQKLLIIVKAAEVDVEM